MTIKKKQDKIIIFDTTLRDGEQAPGASMSIDEKVKIAKSLAKMKVDVIEAGFPISSQAQFDATKIIAKDVKGPVISALARAVKGDIDKAYDAIKDATKPRIHTFIATSDIHMKYKLKKSKEEVKKIAVDSVRYAKSKLKKHPKGDVEFSLEDGTRTNMEYMIEIIEAVIDAGASVINIPDTVGYTTPDEYYTIISEVKAKVKNIDKAILSVHCHDDLGLATANSIEAIRAGARQVECTVNGVGERAGMATLEEIVMALKVREDRYKITTNINTKDIYNISKMVSRATGFRIQPNKAIVGKNAFSHESGIHQDGVIKNRSTYEIISAQSIGRDDSVLIMGRHTGRSGFTQKLKKLGFNLNVKQIEDLYATFLNIADKKKEIYDEDIFAIVNDSIGEQSNEYILEHLQVLSGTNDLIPNATIKIRRGNDTFIKSSDGDGPIAAICGAINEITKIYPELDDYEVESVSHGNDAIGEVAVLLKYKKKIYSGKGASTDIVEASAKAYLNGVNKIIRDTKK